MRHLEKSFILLMQLVFIISLPTFAQAPEVANAKPLEKGTSIKTGIVGSTVAGNQFLSTFYQGLPTSFIQLKCNPTASASPELQNLFLFDMKLKSHQVEAERVKMERAREVWQDNEYAYTGNEKGIFLNNPLKLDGDPLDYGKFSLQSTGELTVSKKATATGQDIQVPFYIYLRRNGVKVSVPGAERYNSRQMSVNLSEILEHAKPGDQLVIEAVNKEDGPVKRILKLVNFGC